MPVNSSVQFARLFFTGSMFLSLLSACDDASLGLTPPYLSASAEKIDFGERVVGTSDERTIFLINKGQTPLTLEIPEGDTQSGIFGAILDSYEVAPNKDTVLSIVFRPSDPRVYTSTLSISNNSSNHPILYVQLLGTG